MRIRHGDTARGNLVKGAKILAKAVGATLGPNGRIVLIEDKFGKVIATKDGVTVARSITLPNNEQNMGVKLLADAALKVATECGDGTTTCVVIAAELLERCDQLVRAGVCPVKLTNEVRAAAAAAENLLWSNSMPIPSNATEQMVALVANVSCNGDERAVRAVVEAYRHVGVEGVIQLRDGDGDRVEVEIENGMQIDRGWHIPALASKDGQPITMENMAVLVAKRVISDAGEIAPLMQAAANVGMGLLVICEAIIGSSQETLIGNHKTDTMRCMTVMPPGFDDRQWDLMADIAAWCGAEVQDINTGRLSSQCLGIVASVTQDRHRTVLTLGRDPGPEVKQRIAALERARKGANDYDRDKLTSRIGRLRGRLATIKSGAPTETEAREIKDRIEDGINAVRVAFRGGVQPGGGTAFLRCGLLPHQTDGDRALAAALEAPAAKLYRNGGDDGTKLAMARSVASSQGLLWSEGLDANGVRCSMLSFPDPTEVVVGAMRSAVSTVVTMLMAETSVTHGDER